LAVLALAGGALLVACNGGDGDDDDGDGGEGPAATEPADGGDDVGNGGDDGGDASGELSDLAGQWATKEAKISYDFTSSSGGTESGGTFTLYWKPPDSWRLDITVDGEATAIISTAGASYICTDAGGQGQCLETPATQIPVPFLGSFLDADAYESLVAGTFAGVEVDRSEETIAGQDAQCYTASGAVEGEEREGQFCFSSDGVPVRMSVGATGSEFTMEATSVETSVADADFEPPYDILQIPVP
jgi:hypothetical protein